MIEYTEEAKNDLKFLDGSSKVHVLKALQKVSSNPLPKNEGGFGNPLGNKQGRNLTGFFKIKLLRLGIRIVYQLIRTDEIMKVIVIAARADEEVYETAVKRIKQK